MKWNPISSSICLVSSLLISGCSSGPTQQAEAVAVQSARIELSEAGNASQDNIRRIEPGDYFRSCRGGSAVLKIEGQKNVVLDLTGVTLRGSKEGSNPDDGQGIGIWIQNCENMEIVGGTVGGYRVGLVIENCDGVQVDGLRIDPAYGHRVDPSAARNAQGRGNSLFGDTPVKGLERSGAGIAIVDSSDVQVRGVHCRGGQNGFVLLRSEGCEISGNDFSYQSGFGIGLQDSDQNVIQDNRCNFISCGAESKNPAGSSGIVLAGESAGNVIASNWAHGGTTGIRVLSAYAACQGNRIVGNDFSGSSAVGAVIRGSSDTWFLNNILTGCESGGVFAFGTDGLALEGNQFNGVMGVGLQLTGGARAAVRNNEFVDCDVALEIHGAVEHDALDHWIAENSFSVNIQDLVLEEAVGIEFFGNDFQNSEPRMHLDGLSADGEEKLTAREVWSWLVDEQGDYPSGRSYHSQLRRATPETPVVLDEAGQWLQSAGIETVQHADAHAGDVEMGDFGPVDPERISLGTSPAENALERMTWDATWFAWDGESDPRGDLERWRAGRFEPLLRREVRSWTAPWGAYGEVFEALPEFNYGMIATGTLVIEESGEYRLNVRSDDGVRILVDGEAVLEDWSWHPERRSSEKIELEAGSHSIELEYFQLDGAAVLVFDLDGPL